jgi:hypothetical protein
MTRCGKHFVALSKLEAIATALGVAMDDLNMVYIVPSNKVKSFAFSSNEKMMRTKQLVTLSEPVASLAAFQRLISCDRSDGTVLKKRKLNSSLARSLMKQPFPAFGATFTVKK